jgi:hypothetical protein
LPWLTVREVLDLHLALYPATEAALLNAELEAFHLLTRWTSRSPRSRWASTRRCSCRWHWRCRCACC